ncbi:hypothetical protein L6164_022905 [Bauhinia variegata]|uniref:Uncharacterized protein n=1 Tax=Bauhinia variegata TaxID=167791 RepID=A0ACB9MGV2_BAUVA|nr:hypothetical protein L6164_022905 [Bauhinia variegata]
MLAQWLSKFFNQNFRRRMKEQKSAETATPGSFRAYVQEEVMAQRMRILEEELAKSREENMLLQSEDATRAKSIGDRFQSYQKESGHVLFVLKKEKELISNSEQHARAMVHTLSEKLHQFKIKEAARVAEQKKQEEYIQVLKNECAMVKEELKEERKLVQMLKREIDEAAQFAKKQTEETKKKLVDALNAAAAENKYAKVNEDLQEERKLVQVLKLELDKATQSDKKQAQDTGQELVNAFNAAVAAITRTTAAEANQELQEEQKLGQMLKLEPDKATQSAKKQTEETGQELVNALNATVAAKSLTDSAESRVAAIEKEHAKVKKELKEEQDLVQMLKLELDEVTQFSNRQAEEKERKLANALNAAAAAESRAAAAEEKISDLERKMKSTADKVIRRLRADSLGRNPIFSYDLVCAICLINQKDLAFGCGHMSCQDCGSKMSDCPICREKITSRRKLFPE